MSAAAGWFDDPGNAAQFRWWDGTQWTEHVQPKPPAAGWFDDPSNAGQLRWWDGIRWTEHVQPKSRAPTPVERLTGLFDRNKAQPVVDVDEGTRMRFPKGEFEFHVVGTRYREDAVRTVAGRRPKDGEERVRSLTLEMRRDPDNEHDPNAIAVWHDKHGQVGFVPRDIAQQLAPALDKASRKLKKPVTLLFTAQMTADWYDDPDEPPDVSFLAMIDEQFRAKPAK